MSGNLIGSESLKRDSGSLCTYPLGAIKRKVELDWGTEDTEYLQKVELHVEGALNEERPDIIVYNAGTDVLDGDPLGGLAISPQVRSCGWSSFSSQLLYGVSSPIFGKYTGIPCC